MIDGCSTKWWILTNSDLSQQISTGYPDVFLTEWEIKSQLFPDRQRLVWLGKSGGNDYIWEWHQFSSSWCNVAKKTHLDSKQRACVMSRMCRWVNTQQTCVVPPLSPGALWSLKEAASPEFKEFEVSAKSSLHQRLSRFICTVVSTDRLPGNVSPKTRSIKRRSRPRVILITAARTRTLAI